MGLKVLRFWGSDIVQRAEMIKSSLSISKVKLSTICAGYSGDLLGADRKTRENAIEGLKDRLTVCAELGGGGGLRFSPPKPK